MLLCLKESQYIIFMVRLMLKKFKHGTKNITYILRINYIISNGMLLFLVSTILSYK